MRIVAFLPPLILVALLNILLSLVDYKVDLTEDKKHSISTESRQTLDDLDEFIFIKVYLDGDFPVEFKHLQAELLNLLTAFKLINGNNFDFEFINPNKEKK